MTIDEQKFTTLFMSAYKESKEFRSSLMVKAVEIAVGRLSGDSVRGLQDQRLSRFCSAMCCQSPALYAFWREHFAFGMAPSRDTIRAKYQEVSADQALSSSGLPYPISLLDASKEHVTFGLCLLSRFLCWLVVQYVCRCSFVCVC